MVDAVKIIKCGDRKADKLKNSIGEMVNDATKPLTMKSIDNNLKQIKNEIRYLRHRNDRIQKEKEDLP